MATNEPGNGRFGPGKGANIAVSDTHKPRTETAVEVVHHAPERFYEVMENGTSVGLLIYEQNPSRTSITHAMVREDRRGHGLGTTLMASALDHLYANNANILVYCDTVARFLDENPNYLSRVNPNARRHSHHDPTDIPQ